MLTCDDERTYDIDEYHNNLQTVQRGYEEYKRVLFITALLFFVAGLVALYFDLTIGAVVLFACSAVFYQGSSHNHLLADMMGTHWSLALLINKHTRDLEVLRSELKQERDSKSAAN